MKVAIGVVCIGDSYLQAFNQTFKPSIDKYCNKFGYHLKIFDNFLDKTHDFSNAISFQKCLVPSQLTDYDLVVVLDADIFITDNAPPITSIPLNDKIGIVDETKQVSAEEYNSLIGYVDEPTQYYKKSNFNLETDKILNTGVIICNPSKHSEFLKNTYFSHIDNALNHPRGFHFEQAAIGFEMQTTDSFTTIPNQWNHLVVYDTKLKKITNLSSAYFLHFAAFGMFNSRVVLDTVLATHFKKSLRRWGIRQ